MSNRLTSLKLREEVINKKLRMYNTLLQQHEDKVEYYEEQIEKEFNKLQKLTDEHKTINKLL